MSRLLFRLYMVWALIKGFPALVYILSEILVMQTLARVLRRYTGKPYIYNMGSVRRGFLLDPLHPHVMERYRTRTFVNPLKGFWQIIREEHK